MPASRIQAQAGTAGHRLPRPAAGARAARWRRLSLPSFALAAITAGILWAAVTELLRQGRLAAVLAAGRAELAAPLLVALVVATGLCERVWPAERRPVLARGHVQDACYLVLHAIVVIPLAWTAGRSRSSRTAGPGRPRCYWPGSSPSRSRRTADPAGRFRASTGSTSRTHWPGRRGHDPPGRRSTSAAPCRT